MDAAFSHPILSCADAGAWEKKLLRDEPAEWAAMERAGSALGRAIVEDFREIGGLPDTARLLVLAGKGHNAGDAMLAAREILVRFPRSSASVMLFFGEQALRPLARRSLGELQKAAGSRVEVVPPDPAVLDSKDVFAVCLDGVFGFQFRPPVDPATAELISRVNSHPGIRLRAAVDLPSGVGETNGATIFRADFTYATGVVKAPVVAETNASFVGRLRYLDLGFFDNVAGLAEPGPGSPAPATLRVLLPSVLRPLAQLRPAHADKRTFGHLVVVAGSRGYPGAAVMAVRAALHSGVGLLTAFVPEALVAEYAARIPEAMWNVRAETPGGGMARSGLPALLEKLKRASAVVIGSGLGGDADTVAAVVELVRMAPCPIVLDADALRPEVVAAAEGKRFVCTPHGGEFKRIAGEAELAAFCRARGGVVALKGAPTRISDGTATFFSLSGGPVLSRGGSGDLLAGVIGAMAAQSPDDLLLAAARGVVWHGLAADLLARDQGQVAVQTTQLLDYLAPALRDAR